MKSEHDQVLIFLFGAGVGATLIGILVVLRILCCGWEAAIGLR
jgi:hypothetical protein